MITTGKIEAEDITKGSMEDQTSFGRLKKMVYEAKESLATHVGYGERIILVSKEVYDTMLVEYESTMGKLETIAGPDGTKVKMNLTAFGYEVVYDLDGAEVEIIHGKIATYGGLVKLVTLKPFIKEGDAKNNELYIDKGLCIRYSTYYVAEFPTEDRVIFMIQPEGRGRYSVGRLWDDVSARTDVKSKADTIKFIKSLENVRDLRAIL